MKIKALKVITVGRENVAVGKEFELEKADALQLIKEGNAEAIEETQENAAQGGENDDPNQTPAEGDKNPTGGENVDESDEGEERVKLEKALDDQYKRDELAEKAKSVGVEFAYDAKKAEIVAAVIDQGKADAVLK